ncbi:MAG TPA: hypothetical protein VD735_00975 [Candidatus Saccharimonadales bacterium]|nr:hypothetical protein [Candidatus Saccharimonadales bacterium]
MAEAPKVPQTEVKRRVAEFTARAKTDAPARSAAPMALPQSIEDKIDIDQEIAREQQIKNENAAQDIRLKRVTLNRLFVFLAAETVLIFVFALMQGTQWLSFHLEDWSFKLLVAATIAQITGMLFVAVRYLFPTKAE